MKLKERKIKRGNAELVCAAGQLPNHQRNVVIFGIYIPPSTRAKQLRCALELLSDGIGQAKLDYSDPIIMIGGDINRRNIMDALEPFPDIKMTHTAPTRNDAVLDVLATNFHNDISEVEIREPLETEDGRTSDHMTLFVSANLTNEARFLWKTITSRPVSKKKDDEFRKWIRNEKWWTVIQEACPHRKTERLTQILQMKMDTIYPVRSIRVRNTDDPWINPFIRGKIRTRKRVFKRERRGQTWREHKEYTRKIIADAKKAFYERHKEMAAKKNDASIYYKAVKRLKDKEAPVPFDICSLFPGHKEDQISEYVADFFMSISAHFPKLTNEDLPTEEDAEVIQVTEKQVEKRLKECKKPKGLLYGDLLPELVTRHAEELSVPLCSIFNACLLYTSPSPRDRQKSRMPSSA